MASSSSAASIPASKRQDMQRFASQKSDADTVRLILEYPALLSAPLDASGRTALMFAAHTGRCNNVRALLARGAPVDTRTNSGATAAWYAAASNKPTALRILLRHGADPAAAVTESNGRHRTIMDVATEKGHADVLEVLSAFLVAVHLHKCRRLMDDYNVLVAQDQADQQAAAAVAAQQEGGEEEAEVETQSVDGDDGDYMDEGDKYAEPRMERPDYLGLRPGEGAEGMPVVEVATPGALRTVVRAEEAGLDDAELRAVKRRRKRRAGGVNAGKELECARAAFEYVLTRMGPELYREFMELMG